MASGAIHIKPGRWQSCVFEQLLGVQKALLCENLDVETALQTNSFTDVAQPLYKLSKFRKTYHEPVS